MRTRLVILFKCEYNGLIFSLQSLPPSSRLHLVPWIPSEKCRLCWSQQKACFWHPFKASFLAVEGERKKEKIEGNEEENFLIIFRSVFFIFPSSLNIFFAAFFLMTMIWKIAWWAVTGSGVFSYNFCVIFAEKKKKWKLVRGTMNEWQWHFRQLKHFLPSHFLLASYRFDEFWGKFSPILLFLFHSQAPMKTILCLLFLRVYYSGEKKRRIRQTATTTRLSVKKWTPTRSSEREKNEFIVTEQ